MSDGIAVATGRGHFAGMQVCKIIALKMAGHLDNFCYKADVAMVPNGFGSHSCRSRLTSLESMSRSFTSCVCTDDSSRASAAGRINSYFPDSAVHGQIEKDPAELKEVLSLLALCLPCLMD